MITGVGDRAPSLGSPKTDAEEVVAAGRHEEHTLETHTVDLARSGTIDRELEVANCRDRDREIVHEDNNIRTSNIRHFLKNVWRIDDMRCAARIGNPQVLYFRGPFSRGPRPSTRARKDKCALNETRGRCRGGAGSRERVAKTDGAQLAT